MCFVLGELVQQAFISWIQIFIQFSNCRLVYFTKASLISFFTFNSRQRAVNSVPNLLVDSRRFVKKTSMACCQKVMNCLWGNSIISVVVTQRKWGIAAVNTRLSSLLSSSPLLSSVTCIPIPIFNLEDIMSQSEPGKSSDTLMIWRGLSQELSAVMPFSSFAALSLWRFISILSVFHLCVWSLDCIVISSPFIKQDMFILALDLYSSWWKLTATTVYLLGSTLWYTRYQEGILFSDHPVQWVTTVQTNHTYNSKRKKKNQNYLQLPALFLYMSHNIFQILVLF